MLLKLLKLYLHLVLYYITTSMKEDFLLLLLSFLESPFRGRCQRGCCSPFCAETTTTENEPVHGAASASSAVVSAQNGEKQPLWQWPRKRSTVVGRLTFAPLFCLYHTASITRGCVKRKIIDIYVNDYDHYAFISLQK